MERYSNLQTVTIIIDSNTLDLLFGKVTTELFNIRLEILFAK